MDFVPFKRSIDSLKPQYMGVYIVLASMGNVMSSEVDSELEGNQYFKWLLVIRQLGSW